MTTGCAHGMRTTHRNLFRTFYPGMTAYTDALLAFSSSSYSLERALERVEAARTVRGVKIDPNSKTVEFVDLPLSVSTEDGHVEIEVTEGIRAALDLPSSCTMDRVRAGTEIGYVVHWDDIERLGSDAVGALPGFKFGELPTLRGPAVVYNPVRAVSPSHGPISIIVEATQDDVETIRGGVQWVRATDVLAQQQREYDEDARKSRELTAQGRLHGQAIHLCPSV